MHNNFPQLKQASSIDKILKQNLNLEITSRLAQLCAVSEPGSRLPTERELSKLLGVGRSTIREVITSLAFIGAVETRQGSGTFVSNVDNGSVDKIIGLGLTVQRSTVHEIVEAREVLEIETIKLATERHDENDKKELIHVMEQMSASTMNLEEASNLDLKYHALLANASHNRVLKLYTNGMRMLLRIWMNKAITEPSIVKQIISDHNAILEAVFARDPDKAAYQMSNHLKHASEYLYRGIGRNQPTADFISSLMSY